MKGYQDNLAHDNKMRKIIQNTIKSKPYVDPVTGRVHWGTDAEVGKKRGVKKDD